MMHFIEPTFNRPDIIARDEATGAELGKSRAQYYLVIPEQNTRHWSRRKLTCDADALAKANSLLDSLPQSTTTNATPLQSCSLCWRHADFTYEHPLTETVHLCKMCQRRLTPIDFLCLLRRDMPRDSYKHAQVWIARHTREVAS